MEPAKVIMYPSDYLAFYDFIRNEIRISPNKAERQLGLWEAICIGLFEHLCKCKSWTFDKNPEISFQKQRQETRYFVERIFGRCVKIGLMPPPPHGSFPDE